MTPGGSEDTAVIDSAVPTLDDYILGVIGPITGSGANVTFNLPTGIPDGAQIAIFIRSEKQTDVDDDGGFVNTLAGRYHYWTYVDDFGIEGPNLSLSFRYASAADSGAEFTFHIGDGEFTYTDSYTLIGVVMRPNPLVNYVGYQNGAQWTYPYGEYHYTVIPFTGPSQTDPNSLFLFAAVGHTNGSLGFNTSPTELASTSNMYVGAKVYAAPTSFGETDISVVTSVPFFIGLPIWISSITATS